MKRRNNRLSNLIATIMITALLLTGAVPSFAWGAESDENASVVLPAIAIDKDANLGLNGKAAIAIDMTTGTTVYEKNADKVREPASLTKVLNALVVLETMDLDQVVTIQDDIETSGSVIYLEPGEEITVEELLYGMLLPSGNDAAEALAVAAGGSVEKFSEMMNERARKCGAKHTDFRSPNGLNENPDQLNYTTARDMALITREAMQIPEFRKIVSTKKHTIPATNKSDERKLVNSNVCLWRNVKLTVNGKKRPYKYEGCNGVKTGFTSDAGYCLIGSAMQNDTDFIVVTLGADGYRNRCRDVIKMWDYSFANYETYPVLQASAPAGVQRVWGGEKRDVEVGTKNDLGVTIDRGTAKEQDFTTEFRLDDSRAEAPVVKGQKMGQALVFNGKGRLVGREDLYALASVGEGGPLSHIGIADEDVPMALGIAGGVLLLFLLIAILTGKRRKKNRRRKQAAIRGELKTMRTAGVGMTATEITDVTGVEEIVPIPKGPARISSEELTAWSSTKRRPQEERPSGSRFGGRTPRGGYSGENRPSQTAAPAATQAGESYMPKMKITPRTPFTAEGMNPGTGQPSDRAGMQGNVSRRPSSVSDAELFAALESTEVYDADQPRHHGKLTEEERREIMRRTRRSDRPKPR